MHTQLQYLFRYSVFLRALSRSLRLRRADSGPQGYAIRVELMILTLQTANRCNILKPSYSKTLQVWKKLVVARFEELNVDVDINQLLIKQYAYNYHDYPKKDAF